MQMRVFLSDRLFYRRVFLVASPLLIQNVVTNLVLVLDNMMLGQLGTEAVAAAAIVNQLIFVFNLSLFGALAGAGVLTVQFAGRGDWERLQQSVRVKFLLAAGVLLLFGGLLLLRGEAILDLFFHQGQEALDLPLARSLAWDYLPLVLLSLLPFAVGQVYGSTLKESGETLLVMLAGLTAVILNLLGNYLLIFGKLGFPALGVQGAALATFLARLGECAILVV